MITYKVVTEDMKSLGLRRNPTILHYPLNTWVSSPRVTIDKDDAGGIWSARTIGGARSIKKYMKKKYDKDCKIFMAVIEGPMYQNNYRVKSVKIKLIKEEV